jgi:vacuolar iron transporter family protein
VSSSWLRPEFAKQVAEQADGQDALGAHAGDELGIAKTPEPHPVQAALASAGRFAVGAAMPLLVTALPLESNLILLVSTASLAFLALLGGAARTGGASATVGAMRVTFRGALAMALTASVGPRGLDERYRPASRVMVLAGL